MAYQRKTMDEWGIWQLVAGEWNEVCTELSRHRAGVTIKLYRENQPEYAHRMKMKRFKLVDHDATQILGFEREAKAGRQEGWDLGAARRKAKREAATSRNVKLTGRELFEYLTGSRFNMTKEQAIANMREHSQDMSFLEEEKD